MSGRTTWDVRLGVYLSRCRPRCPWKPLDTSQLLKGKLDVAALAALRMSDGHGYVVVHRLPAGGLSNVGDASVYGTLHRLATPVR